MQSCFSLPRAKQKEITRTRCCRVISLGTDEFRPRQFSSSKQGPAWRTIQIRHSRCLQCTIVKSHTHQPQRAHPPGRKWRGPSSAPQFLHANYSDHIYFRNSVLFWSSSLAFVTSETHSFLFYCFFLFVFFSFRQTNKNLNSIQSRRSARQMFNDQTRRPLH